MPSKGKNSWSPNQQNKPDKNQGDPNKKPGMPEGFKFRFSLGYVLIALIAVSFFNYFLFRSDNTVVPYSTFKDKIRTGEIKRVEIDINYYTGYTDARSSEPASPLPATAKPGVVYKTVPVTDPEFTALMDQKGVVYSASPREGSAILSLLLNWVLPFAIMFFLWRTVMSRFMGSNSNVLAFGQNRATVVAEGDIKTRFTDVAGVDEAKAELVEVVDFLKNPQKYTEIGGKIPKGVLLVGPPGTGKTLLARAVAGEANVPFFKMSGAEFVEMFVGVGASRVRDLFDQAKRHSPCIVFVDEIDAVGRHRGAGLGGSHDEREQTLNQILVEMDGFDTDTNVIIMAATNRPDILDPALMRPGRFDRRVVLDRPDVRGREAILKVHTRGKPLASDIDLSTLAKSTPGFVGADLENLVNEAAIVAARKNKKSISMRDMEEAVERVVLGPERRSRIISEEEKRLIAFHEAGHAVVFHMLPNCDPVRKVTIVARGMAGGVTWVMPENDSMLGTTQRYLDQITGALGGRAAEEIVFGDVTNGASSDLENVTRIARTMVTRWGMSPKLGPRVFGQKEELVFLGREIGEQRDYSESVAEQIDEEVHNIVSKAYTQALQVLRENRDKLDALAERLIEVETIGREEFLELMGEPPSDSGEDSTSRLTPPGKLGRVDNERTDSDMPPAPLGTAPSPA